MASSTSRSASTASTGTKKAATKKASAKRGAAKKSTRKSAAPSDSSESSSAPNGRRSAAKAESRPAARASQVAAQAAGELLELTGKGVEGVTGLERTDDGWTIQVEVVEVRRIPDTTDVLALYEVSTDKQGSLLGYRRLRRYARGVPGND
jgi:hypothetical protein